MEPPVPLFYWILRYIARRFREKSTYAMFPILFGLYGIDLSDRAYSLISTGGIIVGMAILALLPQANARSTTRLVQYLFDRLCEPTTWISLPVLLGLIGLHLSDHLLHSISMWGIAGGGILSALWSETTHHGLTTKKP